MEKIKITVKGSESIPLDKIEPFQGNLKHIEKEEYEKLRKTILDFGFSFVVHIWKNKGKNYIIDGHQRIFTVNQMVTIEGYEIGEIPCAIVTAKSFDEAKRKVLAAASQYGKMTNESLIQYAKENDIPMDEIVANFSYPEVDYSLLLSKPEPQEMEEIDETPEDDDTKRASDQVRQVQLFYNLTDYSDFISKVENLKVHYNKQNISDTILAVIRANYRA